MKEGRFIVVPQEAEIVKTVFALFLSGLGRNAIMKRLIADGVVARSGKSFTETSIAYMLTNEKYVGDLRLQKTFVVDHLSKKAQPNLGEFPSYYIPDDHEAIIDRETFESVQAEIERRRVEAPKRFAPSRYPFTGMIVCNNCGRHYKRKITNGKVAWNCVTFLQKGKAVCHAKQIPESVLYHLAAEVLTLPVFEESVFKERILEIRVPAFNHLIFVFKDGHEVEKVWQDRSRRESWTDEMKAQAGCRTAERARRNKR